MDSKQLVWSIVKMDLVDSMFIDHQKASHHLNLNDTSLLPTSMRIHKYDHPLP